MRLENVRQFGIFIGRMERGCNLHAASPALFSTPLLTPPPPLLNEAIQSYGPEPKERTEFDNEAIQSFN